MRISVRISDVCSSDLGDCPVGRTEDQAVGRFLATIEFDAVIDGSDGLDPCACLIASEKGGHGVPPGFDRGENRSEEHTSELQSLMRISYAVFCLKKTKNNHHTAQKPSLHRLPLVPSYLHSNNTTTSRNNHNN